MNPPDPARRRWPWIVAFAVPVAVATLFCALLRSEPESALAPLLGPWGGVAVGHRDCTMASAIPLVSWIAVGVGATLLVAWLTVRRWVPTGILRLLTWTWTCLWCGLAALSVLNSTS